MDGGGFTEVRRPEGLVGRESVGPDVHRPALQCPGDYPGGPFMFWVKAKTARQVAKIPPCTVHIFHWRPDRKPV